MITDVNSVSVTGLVRKMNQDSVFHGYVPEAGIFAVADGIGGHARGEIASGMAANGMAAWWEQNRSRAADLPFYTVVELLEKEIRRINGAIAQQYKKAGLVGGCTFCALLIHHDAYAVFNAGDSRLYLCARRRLRQLTVDDVWENLPQVRQLAVSMDLSADPRRGKLSKAMGLAPEIGFSVTTNALEGRMVFFLCSDGVYRHVDERSLQSFLKKIRRAGDPSRINEQIRRAVYENGASDNLSMITVLAQGK